MHPSAAPSKSLSPSVAPSASPTADGCFDSPLRFGIPKEDGSLDFVTCAWVAEKIPRCKISAVSQICPLTCGLPSCSCDDTSLRFKIRTPKGREIEKKRGGGWIDKWKCNNLKGLKRTCRRSCEDEFCGIPICRDFPHAFQRYNSQRPHGQNANTYCQM